MHSKWKVWDFFKANSTTIDNKKKGIYSLFSSDSIITKFMIDQIPRKELEGEKLHVLTGSDITSQWLDDNLQTLGLFGNSESYLIHFAEKIPKNIQQRLLSEEFLLDERYIILVFNESNDFYKAICKNDNIYSIEINPIMFWESKEFLEFMASKLKVYLSFEASQIILDSIEPTGINFYNILNQLKLNFNEDTIDKDNLLEVLNEDKVDLFEFAALFSSKNFSKFYNLCMRRLNSSSIYSLVYFMQSHLLKLIDTSYLDNKKKLTKYDRQILADSKLWNNTQLERAILYFKKLEEMNRESEEMLLHQFRQDYLKSF
jgi:DNA polymerase III delta subunit